jgi:hypothetical protein
MPMQRLETEKRKSAVGAKAEREVEGERWRGRLGF